ncbi:uncharacterized protein LOC106166282 [Lingula anatina]|uniref:Uncharacterized protein LOC106166282 n=1 Tax=Lingula anatina TaxID=7574 RepID=A0A1S3IQQ1_LINAN|nr:uncharacterized protein LOC106166282 [Lingula anatina]|eukprot:XP_013400241.1 uncharacterized protein LOC106166282 [Lingula anatina]
MESDQRRGKESGENEDVVGKGSEKSNFKSAAAIGHEQQCSEAGSKTNMQGEGYVDTPVNFREDSSADDDSPAEICLQLLLLQQQQDLLESMIKLQQELRFIEKQLIWILHNAH